MRLKHALRNSLNPYISTASVLLPMVITHDVLIAYVFGIQSMGGMLKTAVEYQDPHLFGGVTLIYAGILIFGTFVADLLLALTDPRIRTR